MNMSLIFSASTSDVSTRSSTNLRTALLEGSTTSGWASPNTSKAAASKLTSHLSLGTATVADPAMAGAVAAGLAGESPGATDSSGTPGTLAPAAGSGPSGGAFAAARSGAMASPGPTEAPSPSAVADASAAPVASSPGPRASGSAPEGAGGPEGPTEQVLSRRSWPGLGSWSGSAPSVPAPMLSAPGVTRLDASGAPSAPSLGAAAVLSLGTPSPGPPAASKPGAPEASGSAASGPSTAGPADIGSEVDEQAGPLPPEGPSLAGPLPANTPDSESTWTKDLANCCSGSICDTGASLQVGGGTGDPASWAPV
mmetsp:Transcript_143191/g.399134  ORF Transcript_143191/g.399134 Transcript_143191/m.399134 type:complete len:311 (-) Transcript_143191:4065-4997(-)